MLSQDERKMKMSKLINEVAAKFKGNVVDDVSVKFSFGNDDYFLTDCTIYAVTDDGELLPGFKKVKSLLSVENFVAARA